jgi:hypothetical protein
MQNGTFCSLSGMLNEMKLIGPSPRFLCRPTALYIFARAMGRQRAMHTENSGFASPTLGQHISTFRGYRILFSIRNPYINRFSTHFFYSFITLRKWCYTPLQHSCALDPIISPFDLHFSNFCHVTTRKLRLPQCIMGDDLHINKQTNICIANHTRLLRQNN